MWGAFSRERSDLQNLAKPPGHACRGFLADESGATAIEYGLIAALISIVAIPAMLLIGPKLIAAFTTVATNING